MTANPWQRIAIRGHRGEWRLLPHAPVTIGEARELAGLGEYPAAPGCYLANERVGGTTYLVFKGPLP